MRNAPWIVALAFMGLCWYVLSEERDAMDNDAATWRSEQDSLRAELDREKIAHLNDLKLYTDSLKAYTDSAVSVMPPAPVVKEMAWKFFEFAPLGTAVDTLNAE